MGIFKKPFARETQLDEMDVRTEYFDDLLVIEKCTCPLSVASEVVKRGISRTGPHAKRTLIVRTDLAISLAEDVVTHVRRISIEKRYIRSGRLFQLEEPHIEPGSPGVFNGSFVFTSTLLR